MFAVCMGGYIFCVKYAVTQTMNLSGKLIYDTQKRLVDKLRNTEFITFEETEESYIYKNLIESTDILFEASRAAVNGFAGITMIIGSAIYMAVLAIEAFIIIVILISLGVFIFVKIQKRVVDNLAKSKEGEVNFLKFFDDFINGFTEVKMSRTRGDDLLKNHLNRSSDHAREDRLQSENHITNSIMFAHSFFLVLVGCMVFLMPQFGEGLASPIVKLVPVVLFIVGPLGAIIMVVPLMSKSDIALKSIAELEEKLDQRNDVKDTVDKSPWKEPDGIKQLRLDGVTFKYQNNNNNGSFRLGPIDLEIEAKQILFLVGGNGTGKSTLMKILAGLYHPQAGAITLNGIEVDKTNYAHYREKISLILSDFHIFDRLYGLPDVPDEQVNEILQKLQLDQRIKFRDGKFSTVDLSTGQKKRLALLTSLVEDTPILLFDEVSADLDPHFRKYYYHNILPELKAQGRTIIAVSHDDRYFHLADRVVKLDFGRGVVQ
jgi:putative ATP-binding cassette transporter